MTDHENLTRVVKELAVVRGRVTLASGKEADYYVDMRRVTLDGAASSLVRQVISEPVADLDFGAVGGLTLGADPMATAMLRARAAAGGRLDASVVRKGVKSHGLQRRIEGTDITGRRMFVMEDASTAGGSVLTVVEAVRRAGGEVVAVAVIVDRATGTTEHIAEAGLGYCYVTGLKELGL